jgi:hypothetical protein
LRPSRGTLPGPVTFSNFHKAATVDVFAVAPGNLNAEFAPKLIALGSTRLEH